MTPKDLADLDCSIARTLEVVGERWSLLIIRDAFYGVRRFDDFQRDLGVARNILSDRLAKLVERGVLERRQYDDRPARYEYKLTRKGRELLPVLVTLMKWGDRWSDGAEEPPVKLMHTTCGHVTDPVTICRHCGEELAPRDLMVEPLPKIVRERLAV